MERSRIQLRLRASESFVSRNRTVLRMDLAGRIGGGEEGLWVMETRMLSRHAWLVDGRAPQPAGGSAVEPYSWQAYALATVRGDDDEKPAEHAVELHVRRVVGDGMREEVELVNHTQRRARLELKLQLDADFAAIQEARGERKQRGTLTREWREDEGRPSLRFDYVAEHASEHATKAARIHRELVVRVERADSTPVRDPDGFVFHVTLAPHATWRASLAYVPVIDGRVMPPASDRRADATTALRMQLPGRNDMSEVVLAAFERALEDLAALRLTDLDLPPGASVTAGGLPTYVAFFGRDALVVALQASLTGPELLLGALEQLARTQATSVDDWRDAQPGRMVHELHEDPLAALLYEPHGRYYGDVTSSVLYPVALRAHWLCSGDREVLERHVEPAMRAIAWADACSGGADGFLRYRTRSSQGEKNQGWKDSSEAIVWPDGREVEDPLGTCEIQSNLYCAKRSLAAVLRVLGRHADAARLFEEARALKRRFQRTFWMEDEGWIGQAVDAHGTLVRTVASDGADCLVSGIVDRSRAARLVKRMFAPDLFSGWGVRTLSSKHPAYNPLAYQRGSVWPVENAAIAAGLARCGFIPELHALCRAQFDAVALFGEMRLPEVFAGHPRDADHPFPGLYPRANWPQAWSASAVVTLVHSMLGLGLDAPHGRLFVDPHLPEWLPDLQLRGIRVGRASVDLRFVREPGGRTRWTVEHLDGQLDVVGR